MSKMFAISIPIPAGKFEEWRAFADGLNGRWRNEFVESRKKFGVRERAFLQETLAGNSVIVTLEGEDPEGAFAKMYQDTNEFTKWFVEAVKTVHGIDLTQPPHGPLPRLVVDSEGETMT